MLSTRLGASADLPPWAVWLACGLSAASILLLFVELRRRERGGGTAIALTGIAAIAALLAAVVRPARITSRDTRVGARVVVLADTSRSMALAGDDRRPRRDARDAAIEALEKRGNQARVVVLGFGEGAPAPLTSGAGKNDPSATSRAPRSDLGAALRAIGSSADERPAAIVVVSDGRLDDPPEDAPAAALGALYDAVRVPIDTVATARIIPPDASVRHVSSAGAAVAHVPLPLRVDVGCAGGLSCDDIPVSARELRDDGTANVLATGTAHAKGGQATIDLTITLERAGPRIVEIAITAPDGDTIPENDRRLLTFDVARERVRVLHVAGRPTNDVRALRRWLKSDASVDVVAFFILRTPDDEVHASQNDLALIPFPVDELFTEHLPSFDAVVLQDFDAQPYGLEKYLSNLQRYVRAGGGLVMVGGQNSFVAGGYAGTPLADVLPVELDGSRAATGADTSLFTLEWTAEGRVAPLLAPLRQITGEDLPRMPGANVLGDVRPGGVALWTHGERKTRSGAPMPVLAVGDEGDGRTVALGIDGAWQLEFSELAARTAGRGYGALWDGLLGWLMRDPRFDDAQMTLVGGCTAGLPGTLRAHLRPEPQPGPPRAAALEVARIDQRRTPIHASPSSSDGASLDFTLPPLEAGAYSARLRLGAGTAARYDFACEAGGDEWADSRPDPARLEAIARASGGAFATFDGVSALALPAPTVVSAERRVSPVAPPWTWSLAAAALLGVHWLARRRRGLS
ncbi:MAG: hypothetical protein FWD17_05660 [Polyangiaceae bacterium]|nr:hypothetical protein [Polyangiaceae bacterium]